ncbi:MAG: 4-hydroxythreonine-4-phosphate dehydrogenase PdxA [Planctomycetota bacterium]|nr:4-hydroxythreonine-4-phosphate dehydrogenase PdxA [Planctomycetota bacterium]
MAEGIFHLAVAVAPELIGHRHFDGAPGFDRAVNVTIGLPIVRTSVAHGTAFDIAGSGSAETSSLIEAVRVAARIVDGQRRIGVTGSQPARPTASPHVL